MTGIDGFRRFGNLVPHLAALAAAGLRKFHGNASSLTWSIIAINPTAGPQPAPVTSRPELTTHPDPVTDGMLAPHAGAIAPKSG